MRLLQGWANTYAVLLPGLKSRTAAVRERAERLGDVAHHGVVSCLVYVVSAWQDRPADVDLGPLLAVLALGRPCMLAINKASTAQQQGQQLLEDLKQEWKQHIVESAHRRGLESSLVTVMETEMVEEVPPSGVAGAEQLRSWLQKTLATPQRIL